MPWSSKYCEKIEDENKAIILLNSLPDNFREIKSAIKYGRDSLTTNLVIDALRSKELESKTNKKEIEALTTRWRTESQYNQQKSYKKSYEKSRSKSRENKDKDK